MDIRELQIFITLADLLHFGRASQVCHLSPSALSRTIQRLEEELGQALFVRDNRGVELTPAGDHFRRYAQKAVEEFQTVKKALAGTPNLTGSLSIYASITAVYSLLPDLVEAYRKAYPEVQLELRTGAAEKAVAQVDSGEIDIAVAALPERRSGTINFLPLFTTPLVFIAGQQLARDPAIKGRKKLDLTRVPMVLPQTGLSRRRFDQWLKREQIVPKVCSEVSGNEAIIPMVHLGCGVGIVPRLVLERSPFQDQVTVLENAPVLDPYVVGLYSSTKNLRKPVVRAFWSLAEEKING